MVADWARTSTCTARPCRSRLSAPPTHPMCTCDSHTTSTPLASASTIIQSCPHKCLAGTHARSPRQRDSHACRRGRARAREREVSGACRGRGGVRVAWRGGREEAFVYFEQRTDPCVSTADENAADKVQHSCSVYVLGICISTRLSTRVRLHACACTSLPAPFLAYTPPPPTLPSPPRLANAYPPPTPPLGFHFPPQGGGCGGVREGLGVRDKYKPRGGGGNPLVEL